VDFGLKGKTAIVTGAAGGIGETVGRDLAKEGVKLSLGYHNHPCNELVDEIKKSGGEVIAVQADVSKADEVKRFVRSTHAEFGRIDILVNNAGTGLRGSVEYTKEVDWDRLIEINLKSVFLFSKATIPYMKQQRWGRIIKIGQY
jgi:3-oxoacyl-[acyl-carrier protein] reductase